jgi:hypothetical protein
MRVMKMVDVCLDKNYNFIRYEYQNLKSGAQAHAQAQAQPTNTVLRALHAALQLQ